ncbi:MAG: cell division protein FtsI/penicillin-binding protein 2 [Planctomycetota bacterium]|jgi:cell division protein FtsI/penicillin-binding protein 2
MLRRFVPLLVLLGVCMTFLLARLWDIQIVQHEVWSTEAVNLVRSSGVDPYVRGALRDRHGSLITQDEEVYALEFVWRDFRRGHPLGQVAMMRSLMFMRPVGLDEARPTLGEAAVSYASLSPDQIDKFAEGRELEAGIDYVPALPAADDSERLEVARRERRGPRAGDLRYYILRMLRLDAKEIKRVNEAIEGGDTGLSYLELVADLRSQSVEEAREILRSSVIDADQSLTRLAEEIVWEEDDGAEGMGRVLKGGDRLVGLIEARRREVDDDTADALFRIAAGFSSMRVSEENLARFDLRWLRAALDWDEQRLKEWELRRGGAFLDATESWMAGTMIARSKIGREEMWGADRVIAAFAHAFRTGGNAWAREHAAAQDWRKVNELDVISALSERLALDGDLPEQLMEAPVFSFQTQELRTAGLEGAGLVLEAFRGTLMRANRSPRLAGSPMDASLQDGTPLMLERGAEWAASRILSVADENAREWDPVQEALFSALLAGGYDRLQRRLTRILDQAAGLSPDEQRPFGLGFGEPFVEKALEARRYAIRDRGARAGVVGGEPSTELVLLVTRYSGDFAGFRVGSKTRRVPIAMGPDGETPLASKLIGAVRSPFLVEVMQRAPDREELADLKRKHRPLKEDEDRIKSLLSATLLGDESIGGAGLEAWFDEELSGTSGYHEVQGLQDRVEGNRAAIHRAKVDGKDVTLTLDIALQEAAEWVLQHPESPPLLADKNVDDLWFAGPVGAIVLATVGGEILAAASVPVKSGHPVSPASEDEERSRAIDRTLVRPSGQAPGSVVKPLLAAYALEHLGLNPDEGLEYCDADRPRPGTSPKSDKHAGYGVVNCNSRWGHTHKSDQKLDLMDSLKVSCNVYFAALGERVFDPQSMRAAYGMFGFGQPTGVRYDDGRRNGITDDFRYSALSPLREEASDDVPTSVQRQYLGNGLVEVDVNVVQMARAYAALATGFLPNMTLVKNVGGTPVPRKIAALDISEKHLVLVREALNRVVNERFGTAHGKGLSEAELGFALAAKTGSADYKAGIVPPRDKRGIALGSYIRGIRKHTWLAGWFPVEDPRYVVVVYLHDTSATASHSAVYVAGQFLKTDAVQQLMGVGEEGR